jgi:hypothetical protein
VKVEPQKEHEWLHKLVGEWAYESEMPMEPGQAPAKFQGSESVRSLGGVWIVGEGQGEMPGGGSATTIITLGYDARKQRYVGTWVGSMMTNLWVYEGWLDAAGKVLTLESEGPDFTTKGKTAKYRDVIELESDDRRMLTALVQADDGEWKKLMQASYRRQT